MNLLSFLSGPIGDVFGKVGDTIKKFVTTDADRLQAQHELLTVQSALQSKLAELDAQWAAMQRDVVVAEANGHSWLQRNWRPLLMCFFAIIIGTVTWTGGYINGRQLDPNFVMEILSIIKLGLGGYVVGRSAEKIAPQVAQIFSKK